MEKVNHTLETGKATNSAGKVFYKLESQRLVARKLEEGDIDEYYQLFMDNPDLFHETSSDFFEKSEMRQIFGFWELEKDKYCYVLFDKETKQLIGDFNLIRYESFEPKEMEIRYVPIALKFVSNICLRCSFFYL